MLNAVRSRTLPLLGVMLAMTLWTTVALAEEYTLGAEDVVAVSVWLHPELERTVTVSAEGFVSIPPVGDIKAVGLTTKQLSDRIADRLSAYLRQTATVTVSVSQYMSRSVFVQGAVVRPGRYGFERVPSLLDVLGTAGGAIPTADLTGVQIIRKEGETRRTLSADLSAALRTGDTSGLPVLKPGDTVVVPGSVGANLATGGQGVGVLGEVNRPGVYTVGGGQDLWTVLALAGGHSQRANLTSVRVISHGEGGQTVATVNLRSTLDKGGPAPLVVKPGDVVVVLGRGPSAWAAFTGLLALSADALNMAVLVDYLHRKP